MQIFAGNWAGNSERRNHNCARTGSHSNEGERAGHKHIHRQNAAALAIPSFPAFLSQFGLAAVIGFCATIAAGSSVIMHFVIPGTKERLLEEISGEIAEAQ